MANNVGKIIFFLAVGIGCMTMQAYVDLSIGAIDGGTLQQAGAGQPFVITVAVAGHADTEPRIQGLEQFHISGRTKRIVTTNNRTTISYGYQVYCDTPGEYKIGPAVITVDGTSKESGTRVVRVAQHQKTDRPAHKQEAASLQCIVDKSHVVVGERVRCTLQFCGKAETVRLEHIQKPRIDAVVDSEEGPFTRSELRNGCDWTIVEWVFELHSTKAGRLMIPSCFADIVIQKEVSDQLSAFSLFFKFHNEHHKIYSNAVAIEVDELPASRDNVQAVGTFTHLRATLNPSTAKEGEGMVLTLELEGDAQMKAIQAPQLQKMPDALKWYESKKYVHDEQAGQTKRIVSFEYVVQGLQAGKWEIPAQSFTYFDSKERSLKTIKSSPLVAVIKSGAAHVAAPLNTTSMPSDIQSTVSDTVDELCPIATEAWQSSTGAIVPWSLFFIIVIIPLLWALWQGIQLYAAHSAPYFMHRYAFRFARKQLKQARRNGAHEQLLGIFTQALALRLHVPAPLVSQELIIQRLRDAGMSDDKMRSWDEFFSALHEQSYGQKQTAHSIETLFEQARVWLHELEEVL